MREILFKAKRTDNGEWVQGSIVHQTDFYGDKVDRWFIIDGTSTQDYDIGENIEVNPETVCQYTGLTDKNGNKIFEGDVVSYEYTVGSDKMCHKYEVTWEGAGFSIFFDNDGFNSKEVEVIGNIHDK